MGIWKILVVLIAAEHIGFFVLEAILWRQPIGQRIFGLTPEKAELMAPLALNQGVYNLFLAAGLLWAIQEPMPDVASKIAAVFLTFVLVAGVVGGASVKPSIWALQALPAAIALTAMACRF